MKNEVLFAGGQGRSASSERFNCSLENANDNHVNCILGLSVNDLIALAEDFHLGIFIGNKDDRLSYANDPFMGWTGISHPFSKIPITALIHPEDAGHYLSVHRQMMDGASVYKRVDLRLRSDKGSFHRVSVSLMKILSGSAFTVLNVVKPESCINGAHTFQTMVDAYPDMAMVVDAQHRFVAANRRLLESIGRSITDILTTNIFNYLPNDTIEHRKSALDNVIESGNPYRFTDNVNDELYEHYLSPIRDENGRIQFVFILSKNMTDLMVAEQSISTLSRQLLTAIEEERKKIAYDLHDECAQLVAVVSMGLFSLKESLPENLVQPKAMCDHFMGIIETLSKKIRSMSTELHPDMIDHCGLVPAIEQYMDTVFKGVPSITWEFTSNLDMKRFGSQVDIVLYRIIQESITNVIKHAKANHVHVNLNLTGTRLCLEIKDNGIGCDVKRLGRRISPQCMGILGMMERAATIDGTLTIESQPFKGTSVNVRLSMHEDTI